MSISDLETNEKDKNYISIINKKEENNSNNSAQILNKKRKRINSDTFLNEEKINSNTLYSEINKENLDKINYTNINSNKDFNTGIKKNEEKYLYIGCDDGNVKIIKIKDDSFIDHFFN